LTLNDQVQAAEDEEQLRTSTTIRSFNGNQVSNTLLQSLIQNNTLEKEDFNGSNQLHEACTWNAAPLAVTSNCERDHLMFARAQNWAQMKGVPIITWNLQCRGAVMNYIIENNSTIYHNQSGLIGIFVQGAMSYITENKNPAKGLGNGSTVYMHSLSFTDSDRQTQRYTLVAELQNFKPGQQI
jgi:hypothetical protein